MNKPARYFILTIPYGAWQPDLPDGCAYVKGQRELGASGYDHWQLIAIMSKSTRPTKVKRLFCNEAHIEITRSVAAEAYVWKEDTRVPGSQFELGSRPHKRNCARDWSAVWASASSGDIMGVPSPVRVCHYRTVRAIASDFAKPSPMERECQVYWGRTGLGKSRKAWEQLGLDSYPKDPRSKFWDGYQGQAHVIIDEFRGAIDISHILRWTDRYPVLVEIKGSATVLKATKIIFTSNLHPKDWYPLLDVDTLNALLRRLTVVHFDALE